MNKFKPLCLYTIRNKDNKSITLGAYLTFDTAQQADECFFNQLNFYHDFPGHFEHTAHRGTYENVKSHVEYSTQKIYDKRDQIKSFSLPAPTIFNNTF